MNKSIGWFIPLGLLMAGSLVQAQVATPPAKLRADSDMVCGPRSVQFILREYGQEVGLIDLVKELQWPDLEAGASLDQIEKSLNSRSIQTRAIRVAPGRRLTWPHPVVLYTDEGNPPRGHYVVTAPQKGADLIWAGVEGWRRGPWGEITRGFTGVALLTSPDPIPATVEAVAPLATKQWLLIAGLAVTGASLAHLLVRAADRWLSRSRRGASISPR